MSQLKQSLVKAATILLLSFPCLFGADVGITVPDGFRASVIADNLGKARGIAVRDNGDLYVSLLSPVDLNYIAALRDTNGDGTMDLVRYFGEVGSLVKTLKIHDGYLYVGATTQVVRYKLDERRLLPKNGLYEVIVHGFPTPRSHPSKNITFDDHGHLYVSAGAPSNACQEQDRSVGSPGKMPCDELGWGGGVWRFDANKLNQQQLVDGELYATGIRNAVAIQWDVHKGALYTVSNGRDSLNQNWGSLFNERESAEKPSEEFQLVEKGADFGWPYVYWDHERGVHMKNPEYGGDGQLEGERGRFTQPIYGFPGHWAPVGLQFYQGDQFPEKYRGGAFIVFHGSWNRAPLPQQGYNVVFVPFEGQRPSGRHEVFADGFTGVEMLMTPNEARFRPTGIAVDKAGAMYLSEDQRGRIWKIEYTGASASISKTVVARQTASSIEPAVELDPKGGAIYRRFCMACHQVDGRGVPNLQPSLHDSEWFKGRDEALIRLVLKGSEALKERRFPNVMTPFSYLSDTDIALVINYAKARFGGETTGLDAEDVAAVRRNL